MEIDSSISNTSVLNVEKYQTLSETLFPLNELNLKDFLNNRSWEPKATSMSEVAESQGLPF